MLRWTQIDPVHTTTKLFTFQGNDCEVSERIEATENLVVTTQNKVGFDSPKASVRKCKITRRNGKSMMVTDTPGKIVNEKKDKNNTKPTVKTVENAKLKLVQSSEDEEETEDVMSFGSETESWIAEVNPNGFEDLVCSQEAEVFVLGQFKITETIKKLFITLQ